MISILETKHLLFDVSRMLKGFCNVILSSNIYVIRPYTGILVWVIVWIVMGETAAPGGQLFSFAVLTIAAYFGGWLMLKITTLPALIGMLIVGIIMKNVGLVNFDETYQHVASYIR